MSWRDASSTDASSFSLSSYSQQLPRLSDAEEINTYKAMAQSSLLQLKYVAQHHVLLGELKHLITTIDHDMSGSPEPETENGVHSAAVVRVLSVLDELEVVHYINGGKSPDRLMRQLLRELVDWNPPTYLVNRHVDHLLSENKYCFDETQNVSRKLRRARAQFKHHRNRLTNSNIRLVFSVANRYRHINLPYEDLVQEGVVGLMKAVEHFEYTKGFRFSTFAHRIISQNIHLAVEKNDGTVRRPFKLNREKIQADQARIKLEQTLGRPLRSYDLKNVLPETLEYRGVHIQDNVEHTANDAVFLSPIPAVEDHSELDEQQQQAKGLSTYYESKIQTAVEKLDARSAMIVRLRYGIGINKDYTLKEVSDLMQLSAERVRQISLQAIQRISNEFES